MLAAPEERPTGHIGACTIEDEGFEIRDAILVVREGGKIHYVPKAARSEREAGCGHLDGKAGFEAVERKEGSAGVDNPRAGAGRTANQVKNFHPTVKSLGVMVKLLDDPFIPQGGLPVLDPFLGSGTTAVACRMTGHSCVGIEREREYLEIADARVRHWDSENQGWVGGVSIESDVAPAAEPEKAEEISLEDWLYG